MSDDLSPEELNQQLLDNLAVEADGGALPVRGWAAMPGVEPGTVRLMVAVQLGSGELNYLRLEVPASGIQELRRALRVAYLAIPIDERNL